MNCRRRPLLVGTDRKLLDQLRQAGGSYPSQFQLIMDSGVNYSYGFERLKYLHLREYVSILVDQAKPGQGYQVQINLSKLPEEACHE